ncbi:MAG: hypothetical protein JSS02_18685 [Planctomycetes bacterium]|nr:hypothetical protein [Planctomycetota bacterium]
MNHKLPQTIRRSSASSRVRFWPFLAGTIAGFVGCGEGPPRIAPSADVAPDGVDIENTVAEDGHIRTWVRDKPDNLSILESNPQKIEAELLQGNWLIIVFSTLNEYDGAIAARSGMIARRIRFTGRVAIRPSRTLAECRQWIPEYERIDGIDDGLYLASPLWVVLSDGNVRAWYRGRMDIDEAEKFFRTEMEMNK